MPTFPKQIFGHTKQQATLLHDIAKGNVAHAYLFSGPEHIGKSTIARWFAVELLAAHEGTDKAAARSQVERMIHPDFLSLDLLWVEGESEDWATIGRYSNISQKHRSKAPTAKTDTISIDDVRGLISLVHETSQSDYRICLITNIERMHAEAANALLKIIEEPPPRVVFLLTTADPAALLPTITSRTRVLHFSSLTNEEMQPMVKDETDDDATLMLHLSRGAPGLLQKYIDDPDAFLHAKKLHARARSFWSSDSVQKRLSLSVSAQDSRKSAEEFLFHLGLTLREVGSITDRARCTTEYTKLVNALATNTNRGLALSTFTLAISEDSW